MTEQMLEPGPTELYEQAESFITGLIVGPPSPAPGSTREEIRQRAIDRLARLEAFLNFLGNPHLAFRTIHIAGTSGKGSTTSMVASILKSAGLRTGSHVSPYLQVSTEKLLINGRPASAASYATLVEKMRASVDRWEALGNPRPTYGELWVAMTFVYFEQEQVDIGVIEVGAGGRFDLTNVVRPEVAAITSIGYDHTVTLGDTLAEIAWHKAGIIKPGAVALTTVTDAEALPVIAAEARSAAVDLEIVREGDDFRDVITSPLGTSFTDTRSGRTFRIGLGGSFQARNAALASAIVRALPGTPVTDDAIAEGLASARFPGRMETVQESPLVILDGAHNPEKMRHMARNITAITGDRRIIAVFGVLESKNYPEIWAELRPHVGALVATTPIVHAKPPVSASDIGNLVGDHLPVVVEDNPLAAIEAALEMASSDDVVLVTGSLYLVGNIRERWYPTRRILQQGTLWPVG